MTLKTTKNSMPCSAATYMRPSIVVTGQTVFVFVSRTSTAKLVMLSVMIAIGRRLTNGVDVDAMMSYCRLGNSSAADLVLDDGVEC